MTPFIIKDTATMVPTIPDKIFGTKLDRKRKFWYLLLGIPELVDSGRKRSGRWTLDVGLRTLGSGHWTLDMDSGRWNLDAGLWTLDATLKKLGIGHWTLLLTGSEQNQNPVSDSA